jgi:hypothetical protein
VKSQVASKISVFDALTAGLTTAARRPWLILVPLVIDLTLWLAPQLSINGLVLKFFAVWEALLRVAYTPSQMASMSDMLDTMREVMTHFAAQANLVHAITGNWLGPTSALIAVQSTRQTFLSDTLLSPLGLSLNLPSVAAAPWQPPPIEIKSFWVAVLIIVGLWLIGQLLVALYYFQCREPLAAALAPDAAIRSRPADGATSTAASPQEAPIERPAAQDGDPVAADPPAEDGTVDPPARRHGVLALALRLTAYSLLLSLAVLLLRLPLGAALLMTVFSGGAGAGMLFALVGGITLWALLWFLTSLYFSSEGILFESQPVWRGSLQSLLMVRGQALSTFGLVLTINVVLLGFRAVWGFIGQNPVGGAVAILGNAFLTTGMLLAIFVYFEEVRRRWHARQAQAFNSLARRKR